MKRTDLNRGWTLQKGEPSRIPMMPVQTRPVNLPHDFMIEGNVNQGSKNDPNTGYYDGGTYTYTKQLEIPDEWAGQRVLVYVPAGQKVTCRTQLCVENAKIWDLDTPNVYDAEAVLLGEDEAPLDTAQTIFGVRTISVDVKNGFVLNGRSVKLKGGCLHHDNGILGAASFYEAEYRKLKLHKDNGYNAIRCAHNPVSAAFLEACDRRGLLVIEEAFDTWNMSKNLHDYSAGFVAEWHTELEAFMRRDRNHPSIVMWSIGNELPEQGGLSDGYQTSYELSQAARALDATRPICGALCSFFSGLDDFDTQKFWQYLMEDPSVLSGGLSNLDSKYGRELWPVKTEAFCAPWDVVGYNYLAPWRCCRRKQ